MPGFDPEIGKLAQRVLITPAEDGKPIQIELIDVETKEPKDTLELEVEARIVDDPDLSDESPLDESQRLEKFDEHYVECAGTTQQSTYEVGNYGSLMSSHQRNIERAREEGRAQGRAEIQNKLDEVLA